MIVLMIAKPLSVLLKVRERVGRGYFMGLFILLDLLQLEKGLIWGNTVLTAVAFSSLQVSNEGRS